MRAAAGPIPLPADGAGVVTDTLTVKVGYYGMAADKYVEAGTYHWTELMDNLPLHIQTGDAWDYAVEVEPMLALEDSWVAYDVGTENVRPNFNSMTTGNRFRLLFGQTQPTESRTNQSAKYTHTVYVTLKGTPKVVQEPQELDGAIGIHTAQLTLSVSDPSLLEHLQQLLEFTSSDGSVLTIDGWTVTPDARYSDLVTVSIQYTVLREGSASINGSVAGMALSARPGIELPDTPTGPGQSGDPGQSGTSPETPASVPDSTGTSRDTERILDQWAAQSPAAPKTDVTELPDGRVMIPLTAQQAAQLLQGGGSDPDTENRTGSDSAPAEQVDDMTLALLLTGAGALLLAAAGAAMQTVYYRKERNA